MPSRLRPPLRLTATAVLLLAPALVTGCGPTLVGPPSALLLPCGAHAERGDDGLSCRCTAGYRDTGALGDAQCVACDGDEACDGEEAAAVGAEPNPSCPAHAQPAGEVCLCDAGYYLDDAAATEVCLECPEGADCHLPGTTRETLRSLPGYYRASGDTVVYYRCAQPSLCGGDPAPSPSPSPSPSPTPSPSASPLPCPAHATRADPMSACLCDVGYYHDGTTSTVVCLECPVGADCRLPGTTRETMSNLAGYYRTSADDLAYYRCAQPALCPGGTDPAPPTTPGPCGPHTVEAADGTCSCAPGYFDDIGEGLVCWPCPEGASCTPTTNTVLPLTLPGYFQPQG